MTLYHGPASVESGTFALDLVEPLFALPARAPRSAGSGWTCRCAGEVHGRLRSEWRADEGWVTVSADVRCSNRRAVSPAAVTKVRPADAIKARPLLVAMVPPPAGLTLPLDVHRLIPRLLKLGVAPDRHGWLTYSLHWWSTAVKLDDAEIEAATPPPDADRVEGDERDDEGIELPTGERVKRVGRTTRDVAVLRESLALRAWPIGVVLWLRRLDEGEKWKPDGGFVRGEDGRPIAAGVKMFKQLLKELEK